MDNVSPEIQNHIAGFARFMVKKRESFAFGILQNASNPQFNAQYTDIEAMNDFIDRHLQLVNSLHIIDRDKRFEERASNLTLTIRVRYMDYSGFVIGVTEGKRSHIFYAETFDDRKKRETILSNIMEHIGKATANLNNNIRPILTTLSQTKPQRFARGINQDRVFKFSPGGRARIRASYSWPDSDNNAGWFTYHNGAGPITFNDTCAVLEATISSNISKGNYLSKSFRQTRKSSKRIRKRKRRTKRSTRGGRRRRDKRR